MSLRDGSNGESGFFGGELPEAPEPGMVLADRYELLRKIGSGSMGDVWAARHQSLGEEVAIKLVVQRTAADGSSTASRFLFEARVAAQLSRKTRHIVTVTDHGEHGAHAYLVMELLRGESLEARLERGGPLEPAQVTPVLHQIARALSVAHADGIVHRDLKTSNVFVTIDEEGRALVKILDFGIAKARGSVRRLPVAGALNVLASNHETLDGFLLGTPPYMSPEQACGAAVDHRADVWALGVMAYHLLTNEFPFDAETPESMLAKICSMQPTPITDHRPELPPAIASLFAHAFADSIRDRYQTAVDFAHAFELAARSELRAITLPPGEKTATLEARMPMGTIIAAGVPRRRKLAPLLFAALFAIGIVGALGAVLFIYFEPVPPVTATTTVTMAAPRDTRSVRRPSPHLPSRPKRRRRPSPPSPRPSPWPCPSSRRRKP